MNLGAGIFAIPRAEDLEVPPEFPATLGEFRALTGQQIDVLLNFYGLAMGGNVNVRRIRLGNFLNIRVQ